MSRRSRQKAVAKRRQRKRTRRIEPDSTMRRIVDSGLFPVRVKAEDIEAGIVQTADGYELAPGDRQRREVTWPT